ncbi:MAG: hypothetical protein EOP58_02440 [Sphingomonadales bacterium]|nr:MAG: hypothetical protein EOP58_02440 [Sphingomonadales bacterium]
MSPKNAEEFRASLKQRAEAAKGLEKDLLSEVPQLYGAPDQLAPDGDPGISLAKIHREELKRRNGGGVPDVVTKPLWCQEGAVRCQRADT